ncbi:MAG: protein kinase [Deltaproteobacteria bacterium]|nr:protein kinase [Deltaproteobacteria bacterium]
MARLPTSDVGSKPRDGSSTDQAGRQTKPVEVGQLMHSLGPDAAKIKASQKLRSSFPPPPDIAEELSVVPGTVLEGKYKIVKEIGHGAMGTVFLAEDITLKRKVAVKFLLPNLVRLGNCAESFRNEAVAMASIRDQNVAQIYTYGELDEMPYFIMEYLDGHTAEHLVDEHNRLGKFIPISEALDIVWQMLGGLVEIHRSGTVHRDIKPANIVLTGTPLRAVILDFGLVRDVRMNENMVTLAGTPAYIAPELVEKKEGAASSPLVDVYSAGSSAYELLTGTIPFTGKDWYEILRKRLTEDPEAPSSRRSDLPGELDDIILKALSRDPRDRFKSCNEFLRSLMLVDGIHAVDEPRLSRSLYSRSSSLISSQSAGKSKLLIVDADSEFRGFVQGTVGVAVPGCQIKAAADSETARNILDELAPNVVLVDFSNPSIGGAELAATVQANSEYKSVEIVAVTDEGAPLETEILEWLGVTHFFQKPISVKTLTNVLRPLLV